MYLAAVSSEMFWPPEPCIDRDSHATRGSILVLTFSLHTIFGWFRNTLKRRPLPLALPHPGSNRRWSSRKLSYSYVNESRGQVSFIRASGDERMKRAGRKGKG